MVRGEWTADSSLLASLARRNDKVALWLAGFEALVGILRLRVARFCAQRSAQDDRLFLSNSGLEEV